ncbi:ethanolamine ammonia-lyase subunit EutC [Insolitispirillum peregrinum]|uniref:Ethanolamine ammonia-lyase small subunit n=1 Tax=Insolitispirillum peregrinum TaxID=80876 RepID=A0A1N7QAA4_9PROT|nr:ethanolamine ammonia-lyase subunit EutC [Insolitispirillum peregrinum]SIT19775.1 Ethanolamine ammonia-lyase light chain [Insolitispirillum peregrinum]
MTRSPFSASPSRSSAVVDIDSQRDPFARLRPSTRARIGLGRAGDGLPTDALLDFQLAHARARDAVHAAVDWDTIATGLHQGGWDQTPLRVQSRATNRPDYLRRPDWGRRLDAASVGTALTARDDETPYDLAFVLADGLSATAVMQNGVATLLACRAALSDWRIAPPVFATQARVALGDEVGQSLNARMVAILIGERPGLSVAESLGIYLTWHPLVGRRDSERNCISNIHPDGLSADHAAALLAWLAREGQRLAMTGVDLKPDERALLASPGGSPAVPGPSEHQAQS